MSAVETESTPLSVLLRDAIEVYADDPKARDILKGYQARLGQPLRIAIAGMVKAGKSTLLNAMIGEEVAPTDAGECTRIVTWYRYGDTPKVTLELTTGERRALAITRERGRLVFDIGAEPLEEIARIVVDWPAQGLRRVTLIDTPGIASLSSGISERSNAFLVPRSSAFEVDAVVYLLRHMHAADVNFLESFRDLALGRSRTVNALAVLSRADEIGAGRIDALISARDIADRYRHDDTLRRLVLGVVPVAGLLAQTARTLRQSEFAALVEVAHLDREDRERLLISADRFVRPTALLTLSSETRSALLDRFGVFGIRMAAVLITAGADDAPSLARELARHSGLDELQRMVTGQFSARAAQLQSLTVLTGVDSLVHDRPHEGDDRIATALERIIAGAHEITELQTLATLRLGVYPLDRPLVEEAERLIGGVGTAAVQRLALDEDASREAIHFEALASARRWRQRATSPLSDHETTQLCETVVRSCEAILTGDESRPPSPGGGSGPVLGDLTVRTEPVARPGKEARYERRAS
ncbi:dynamin family protein [Compostimonas suwonensis]|uniref:Dynamin family protein n=1 Tax=Compostimonas suwonensis TaxID=1048394 RepID=A0A2M9BZH6_9MICO|nr:dynamin family protein [Compostimonas suwonensis]PJJ63489.1 dynamin family protein [Compostimonas suwonensis]